MRPSPVPTARTRRFRQPSNEARRVSSKYSYYSQLILTIVFFCLMHIRPELDKPASTRMSRLLASILDKCIRCSNSQYDDADVLKRLDVRISEPSLGDTGWDVFSLDYKVDGPLATVLTPEIKARYETLFHALWRSKRMEWIMSKLRHQQLTDGRLLRDFPGNKAQFLNLCEEQKFSACVQF